MTADVLKKFFGTFRAVMAAWWLIVAPALAEEWKELAPPSNAEACNWSGCSALTLDPQGCLVTWDENSQRIFYHMRNNKILRTVTADQLTYSKPIKLGALDYPAQNGKDDVYLNQLQDKDAGPAGFKSSKSAIRTDERYEDQSAFTASFNAAVHAIGSLRASGSRGGTGALADVKITSMALDSKKNIYFIDDNRQQVLRFDNRTNKSKVIGVYGKGAKEYLAPVQLRLDAADRLYVREGKKKKIIRYGANGQVETVYGLDKKQARYLSHVKSFDVDPEGGIWILGRTDELLVRMDGADGSVQPWPVTLAIGLRDPCWFGVGPDREIMMVYYPERVVIWNGEGEKTADFKLPKDFKTCSSKSSLVWKDGEVWACDAKNWRLWRGTVKIGAPAEKEDP